VELNRAADIAATFATLPYNANSLSVIIVVQPTAVQAAYYWWPLAIL